MIAQGYTASATSPAAAAAAATEPRTAILVVHGMGQQIPFSTLDAVANGLGVTEASARMGKVGDEMLARLETRIDGRKVHLYEAYWAPVTEGRITLRQVVRFLLGAGINGLRNSTKGHFLRWSFGSMREIPLFSTTLLLLGVTTLLVLSLIVINAAILALGADALAKGAEAALRANALGRASDGLLAEVSTQVLAANLNAVLAVALAAGLSTALATATHGASSARPAPQSRRRALGVLDALAFVLQVAAAVIIVLAAVACGLALVTGTEAFRWLPGGRLTWIPDLWESPEGGGVLLRPELVWLALLAASWKVRGLLVQYVGDVAIYVMPYGVDGFDDLRKEIRERVLRTARAIYASSDGPMVYTYERVLVVGHSLGSVLCYDVLNKLVLEDEALQGALAVSRRTQLLLTFGSPLDKTAFIFSAQGAGTSEAREALAASVQPLIRESIVGPRTWINVHAGADPISGRLDLYSDPDPRGRQVTNVADLDATTPLVAHTQYWTNQTVWKTMRPYIAGMPSASKGG